MSTVYHANVCVEIDDNRRDVLADFPSDSSQNMGEKHVPGLRTSKVSLFPILEADATAAKVQSIVLCGFPCLPWQGIAVRERILKNS